MWNRQDTRKCPPAATTLSLFCALHRASLKVLGRYDHRAQALEEVRTVIDERGKDYQHRLMGFNNDPSTSFPDIKAVLAAAGARVRARLEAAQ